MTTPAQDEIASSLMCMPITTTQGGIVMMSPDQVTDLVRLIEAYKENAVIEARIDEIKAFARAFSNRPFDETATLYAQGRIHQLTKESNNV